MHLPILCPRLDGCVQYARTGVLKIFWGGAMAPFERLAKPWGTIYKKIYIYYKLTITRFRTKGNITEPNVLWLPFLRVQ